MSVPRVKCASCGSEWDGPVVFCGECGTPVATPSPSAGVASAAPVASSDRAARLPPPSNVPPPKPASTPAPAVPLSRPATKIALSLPTKPVLPPAKAAPAAVEVPKPSRPSEPESRRTVMGMPPVPAAPAMTAVAEATKPTLSIKPPTLGGRRDAGSGGRKNRRGSMEKMLDDLDAGFDSIVRPSDLPPVPPPSAAMTEALPAPPPAPSVPVELPAAPAEPPVAVAPPPVEVPVPAAEVVAAEPPPVAAPPASEPDVPSVEPRSEDQATRAARHEADMVEVRALFSDMAVAHARPLRDFSIEVSLGEPTKEWLDVAAPAASSLRRAAEAVEMPELCAALEGFTAALELVAGESAIHREAKDLLLGAYGKLVELLPAAFALEGERGRREPIIVRSLLLQVPGVHKVTLDKIYTAGLGSLASLTAAGARDLAETTGLDVELAGRVVERVQRYKRELAELDPAKDRARERAELEALVAELGRLHEEHERLASAWTPDALEARVRARRERGDTVLRINVLLAHLGEVDRLTALEKLPFQQKIVELSRYLDEARRKASRP